MSNSDDVKISVIVPIYNAQQWLRQCIESIVSQTHQNLDIILVDDGSSDESGTICREYADKDPRIRIISKDNSGVSDSRNMGIEAARGEYITFVDADDYLSADILAAAADAMEQAPCELCVWNVTRVCGGTTVAEPPIPTSTIPTSTAITATVYDRCADIPLGRYFRASWAKLYSTQIIKTQQIRFEPQQRLGEDALFLIEYLKHMKQICVVDSAGYFYRITDHSAARRYRTDLLPQNQQQVDKVCAYLQANPMLDTVRMRTAVTCLAWDVYRKLLKNQSMQNGAYTNEAQIWFELNKEILRNREVSLQYMPKSTKIVYLFNRWIPEKYISRIAMWLMKRGK